MKSADRNHGLRRLSELEGVAIGITNLRQPCTAYSLRMELRASPSSHWRASAGAMYPLLVRLEKEGLIKSAADANDGRGRMMLTTTPLGKKRLKAWIKDIVSADLISDVSDPVRSRVFVLTALAADEQIRFAADTLLALQNELVKARQYLEERPSANDVFQHLGAIGGVINTKARIEFMKLVLKELTERSQSRLVKLNNR